MPIHGTAITIPKYHIRKIKCQVSHHSHMPCFNCISLINCWCKNKIFTSLYLAPAPAIHERCTLINIFQETFDNLIPDCGASQKIYVGADLIIDIDANHPRDKNILKWISELLESLALKDILRVKHLQAEFSGHTFNP